MSVDWSKYVHLFGKVHDADIANLAGVSREAARQQRVKLGIPRYQKVDWTERPIGDLPDSALGRALGVSGTTVARERVKRGIPLFRDRKREEDKKKWRAQFEKGGTAAEIAQRVGVSVYAVNHARIFVGMQNKSFGPRGIDWDNQLLGRKPDIEIAREVGVSGTTVCLARKRRGIPPYRAGRRP